MCGGQDGGGAVAVKEHDPSLSVCLFVITAKAREVRGRTSESTTLHFLSKKLWEKLYFLFLSKASQIKCLLFASIGEARFNPCLFEEKVITSLLPQRRDA